MARWQRERQQQAVVVTVFTAIIVFVVGLGAWAAADRYYQQNLTPAAQIQGITIAKREYQAQLGFDLVGLYFQFGVPAGRENDPQIQGLKGQYGQSALDKVVEHRVLDRAAREAGVSLTPDQVDDRYAVDYGEFKVRHILVAVDQNGADKDAADATAKAKARAVADELRSAPMDQDVWNRLAKERSDDPGSKDSGGDLGFASLSGYVAEFRDAVRALPMGAISEPVRSQFGYHVIQLEDKRDPRETDLFKRYRSYGYGVADLKAQSRYEALRDEFDRRARTANLASPTAQVRLAKITVAIPAPSSGDFQSFTNALQKQARVREALAAGTDFAQVAKENSDDTASKDKGGDIGWVSRGMLTDIRSEDLVFATEAGKVTDPISTASDWTVYKVVETDPARELAAEQKDAITRRAYQYWLERQKKAYDVKKLLFPGIS